MSDMQDIGDGDVLEGFGIIDTSRGESSGLTYGAADMGMTAHRGVLQEGEYVDPALLREAAEEALGFTYDDVSSVYRQGRLGLEQRQLRERIDSRLLALSRSGGNMTLLATTLELGGSTIDRAIARAKQIEVAPIVKNPAVRTRLVCFKCGEDGATPRRRRHSKSPEAGTVDLCDEDYAKGFEHQPGNPAYWAHRNSTRPVGV